MTNAMGNMWSAVGGQGRRANSMPLPQGRGGVVPTSPGGSRDGLVTPPENGRSVNNR